MFTQIAYSMPILMFVNIHFQSLLNVSLKWSGNFSPMQIDLLLIYCKNYRLIIEWYWPFRRQISKQLVAGCRECGANWQKIHTHSHNIISLLKTFFLMIIYGSCCNLSFLSQLGHSNGTHNCCVK